jgi:hypothetical protein
MRSRHAASPSLTERRKNKRLNQDVVQAFGF